MSSNLDQFVAGGVGGMAGVIAGHPLGTVFFFKSEINLYCKNLC